MATNNFNIVFSANSQNFNTAVANMQSKVQTLGDKFKGSIVSLSAGLNSLNILSGLVSLGMAHLREAADFEKTVVQLEPFLKGIGNAKELMISLREESANGVASIQDLADTARRLAGVFNTQSEIKAWTNALHNLSAATGKDIKTIAEAFAKTKFGAPATEMLDQLGIYRQIAEQIGVAESELKKAVQTGEIGFKEVEAAIYACSTGTGVFAQAAANLSNTFAGTLDTIDAKLKIVKSDLAENVMLPALTGINWGLEKYKSLVESISLFAADPKNYSRNKMLIEEEQAVNSVAESYKRKREEFERLMNSTANEDELRAIRAQWKNTVQNQTVASSEWSYEGEYNEILRQRKSIETFIEEKYTARLKQLKNITAQEQTITDEKEKQASITRAQQARESYEKLIEAQALLNRTKKEQLEYLTQKAGGNSTALRDRIYDLKNHVELSNEQNNELRKTIEYYNKIVQLEREIFSEQQKRAENVKKTRENIETQIKLDYALAIGDNKGAQEIMRNKETQNLVSQGFTKEEAEKIAAKKQAIDDVRNLSSYERAVLGGYRDSNSAQTLERLSPILNAIHSPTEPAAGLTSIQQRAANASEASVKILEQIETNTRQTLKPILF